MENENNTSSVIADILKKYRPSFSGGSNNNSDSDSMKKLLIIIIVLTIITVILLTVFSGTSTKKSSTYADVEDTMIDGAKKFFSDNKKYLPKSNGGTVEISAQKLINEKYLASNYASSSCSGKVVVQNNDDNFVYIPYLDCGSKYKTTEFYRKITDSNNIVKSGNGLYNENGTYVFKGDNVNNYIQIDNILWRVVKVTENNETVLIRDRRADNSISFTTYPWDDRLNLDKGYNVGINNFSISRIKDTVNTILDDKEEPLINEDLKGHIVLHSFCTGKRNSADASKNMQTECTQVTEPMKVGLLTVSEFMNASLDGHCNTTMAESCENYNYLNVTDYDWWTITANSDNSYEVYYVAANGSVQVDDASTFNDVRPVIYLDSNTMFKSGKGTEEKPYKIR